ncbi:MAG: hypothetical protein R3F49_05865 [Planctomycetota bacterium]
MYTEIALAAALSAPLALLASELALRAFYRRRGAAWVLEPGSVQIQEIDRETLPALEPEVRIEVNRDGERGAPPPADWRRTFRVLVAGGSAAECFLLDQETQWPSVVARELQARAAELGVDRVHVGNIARSLVRCEYVEWMLNATLPRMPRLDAVVLMVGASDLVAWLEQGCPAEVTASELDPNRCFQRHDFGPFRWRPGQLALRELVKRVKNRLVPSVVRRTRAGKSIAKHRKMRASAETLVREAPDARGMLALYEEYLRRTIEAARSTGAKVLVARQPWLQKDFTPEEAARLWNFGKGRPYEGPVTTYFAIEVVHRLMAAVDEVSARVAAEMGVGACELRTHLDASFDTFYDTLHFTPRGAAAVGKRVAEALATLVKGTSDDRPSVAGPDGSGSHGSGSHESGPYESGPNESGPYESGRHGPSAADSGALSVS